MIFSLFLSVWVSPCSLSLSLCVSESMFTVSFSLSHSLTHTHRWTHKTGKQGEHLIKPKHVLFTLMLSKALQPSNYFQYGKQHAHSYQTDNVTQTTFSYFIPWVYRMFNSMGIQDVLYIYNMFFSTIFRTLYMSHGWQRRCSLWNSIHKVNTSKDTENYTVK